MSAGPLLEAHGVHKAYGQVQALRGADFTVMPGEVVALVGDNGAGKSTLVRILAGADRPDQGQLLFEGRKVTLPTTVAARELGIETVYQDLALAPHLDPAANLFLGRELLRGGLLGRLGFLDRPSMARQATDSLRRLGLKLKADRVPVTALSGGQRQGVAVSRAVMWASRVIFMDEPTAALGVVQKRNVLDLIRRVRDTGAAVVLISHNMPEVVQVADRVEVLRHGRRVAVFKAAEATIDDLVGAMTGSLEGTSEE